MFSDFVKVRIFLKIFGLFEVARDGGDWWKIKDVLEILSRLSAFIQLLRSFQIF